MSESSSKLLCRGTFLLGMVLAVGLYTSYQLFVLSNDVFDVFDQEDLGMELGDSAHKGRSLLGSQAHHAKRIAERDAGTSAVPTSTTMGPKADQTTDSKTTITTTVAPQSTTSTSTSTSTTTTTQTTTYTPTTAEFSLPAKGPCFDEKYDISQVCDVQGTSQENATLEEITSTLFLEDLVGVIEKQCEPGTWCLGKGSKLEKTLDRHGQRFVEFCPYQDCLLQMPDDCLDEERRLVVSTLIFLCHLSETNFTDHCMLTIREMLHVTMADTVKSYDPRRQDTCMTQDQYDNCSGSCQETAHHLQCMSAACEGCHLDLFQQFAPWQWFFSNNDTLQRCDVNATTMECIMFRVPQDWLTRLFHKETFLDAVKEIDVKLVSGIAGALVAAILGIVITACVCVRKRKDSVEYKRDRVGYSEVTSMDIDVDEEFET